MSEARPRWLLSVGISSTLFLARALGQHTVPTLVVSASLVLNIVSYNIAYVVCLVAALWIMAAAGYTNILV